MVEYIYGPVPSRRLGQSLGISPIPVKTCNYNCIYCQLGKTTNFTNCRQSFFNPQKIIKELKLVLEEDFHIDYLTFVGEGEPTLSKDIGFLINEVKKVSDIPIAVITNGSLLSSNTVRDELRKADTIIPTFDAGNSRLYRYINRPHKEITFDKLVQGLKLLRKEFKNEIWLEVMLIKDINDSVEQLNEIQNYSDIFEPDQVQINIPSRPPTEKWVKIPNLEKLNLAKIILQSNHLLPLDEDGEFEGKSFDNPIDALLFTAKRHPLQYEQAIKLVQQFDIEDLDEFFKGLVDQQLISIFEYRNKQFIYKIGKNN